MSDHVESNFNFDNFLDEFNFDIYIIVKTNNKNKNKTYNNYYEDYKLWAATFLKKNQEAIENFIDNYKDYKGNASFTRG